MGRSPERLTPEQKDAIYELKRQGKSGRRVVELIKAGYGSLAPFTVAPSYANEVYRRMAEAKGELYETTLEGLTTKGSIDKLTTRLLRIAERETQRLERAQARGKLDAAQLAKLGTALERIHRLDEARSRAKEPSATGKAPAGDASPTEPQSFAERLAASSDTPPLADEIVKGDGASPHPPVAPTPPPRGNLSDSATPAP